MSENSDEFQMVGKKGANSRRNVIRPSAGRATVPVPIEVGVLVIKSRFDACEVQFNQSQFWPSVRDLLPCAVAKVVCLGLGHFSTCGNGLHQLVLLHHLSQHYQSAIIHVYDPIFTKSESEFLKSLGLQVRDTNELGCIAVEPNDQHVLYYMPHCGRPLYNNVIWTNYSMSQLARMSIIGNRLSSDHWTKHEHKELQYLLKYAQIADQRILPEYKCSEQAFNDTAILTLNGLKARGNNGVFWERADSAPVYDLCRDEIS